MSYELADARVEDMRAEVWKLTRVTFTGAAILLREKAAYLGTSFRMTSNRRLANAHNVSEYPRQSATDCNNEEERNGIDMEQSTIAERWRPRRPSGADT